MIQKYAASFEFLLNLVVSIYMFLNTFLFYSFNILQKI